ncbi:MAG: hypothetical protein RLW61_11080 [Gammaproteobacteria bacterium]
MFRSTSRLAGLLGLCLLAPAVPAATTGAEATLAIDVHASGTQAWQSLDAARVAALAARLERDFTRAGFGAVVPRWCTADACASQQGAPQLALDVTLGEARAGNLSRGFAIDLGGSNPRDAGRIRGTLLAVGCRLRTPGGRLVAARDSDEPVTADFAAGDAIDGDYLGRKIADACAPLVAEQSVVLVAPVRGPEIITTADPEVFIEKREVAADAPLAAVLDARPSAAEATPGSAATASTTTVAGVSAAAAVGGAETTAKPLALSREAQGKRTQYVLHNKGDTVYLEFGRRR